jgi:hypothetical protein
MGDQTLTLPYPQRGASTSGKITVACPQNSERGEQLEYKFFIEYDYVTVNGPRCVDWKGQEHDPTADVYVFYAR